MTTSTIEENVSLAPYTTLKIGGRARFFVNAHDEDQLIDALRFAQTGDLPVFILGGGSNVLISDEGFNGLVIHIAIGGVETTAGPDGDVLVTANAGEDWDGFVELCVENNYAGVECLSGIPGLVGGTPVQNVGAYGQEVAETIVSVRCLDRRSSEIVTLENTECGFSYRTSIFNSTERDRYVVLGVTFRFTPGGLPKLVYKDLIDYIGERPATLADVRQAVLTIRRAKSMVIDLSDPNSRSAGSFFKNPIVSLARYLDIVSKFGETPKFPFDDERVKVPAAWLIERAGFHKGFQLGEAGISSKHTLAVINRGNAVAKDIIRLKSLIQEKVAETFGIDLETEPVFVGFS